MDTRILKLDWTGAYEVRSQRHEDWGDGGVTDGIPVRRITQITR